MVNGQAGSGYRFTLAVQRRTDSDRMPLDKAMVEWPEDESPFVPVATLVIPRQDVEARGQSDYGQNLSFNIWRVPPENRPTAESSIAVVRRNVYAAGAALRQPANGQLTGDPLHPRPAESTRAARKRGV